MRKLGIDFGTKKVGLALSDLEGKLAFPHAVIPNDAALLDTIERMIADEEVDVVVIGQSLDLDGTPNAVQADIEAFIADLTQRTPVPIHLEPEQLTTQQAAAVTGKNDQTDAAAAAIILDTWLQKQTTASDIVEDADNDEVTDEPTATPEIAFDDFLKVDIRLGTIVAVEIVDGADKLLQLTVDLGESQPRQILSGIREFFADEQELVGRQCPFVTNLPPRTIRGLESQGMILAADHDDTFALFSPDVPLPPGTPLR